MHHAEDRPRAIAEEPPGPSDSSCGEDDAADMSSSAGPPRKRKKFPRPSCELCKARKVKCDRAQPACSWCARHKRACVYLERQNPGSRIVFGLELEAELSRTQAKLEDLERRFNEHLADEKLRALPARPASPPLSASQAPVPLEIPAAARRRSDYAGATPASHQGGTPPISSTHTTFRPRSESDPRPPHERNGEPFVPLHPPIEEVPPPTSANGLLGAGPIPLSPALDNNDLPPQDMLYALTDLYFKHCNTWCPILDRKTVFRTLSSRPNITEEDRVLLHAIVSAALRFFHDPRLGPEARTRQYALSKRTVQMYAVENVSVGALRARIILCLDIMGASNGPAAGMVLSQLSQTVRQLGLCDEASVFLTSTSEDTPTRSGLVHRLSTAGQPGSWLEDEGRRRLCWMVYILDRYAAMAAVTTGYTLADADVRRVLPCSYDLFSGDVPVETNWFGSADDLEGGARLSVVNKSENLGSFSYHCEMITILSRVHSFATTPLDISSPGSTAAWRNKYRRLDETLDGWLQSLPGEYGGTSMLCHSDPASRVANWFLLHSAYVVAVVRLHAPAAYPMLQSPLFVPSDYAIQRCMSAVHSLGGIVHDVREADGLYLLGPLFTFSLWVAARLLLVNAAAMGCPVDPMVDMFIQTLDDMGRHWQVASCYSRILARVVQRGRQGDGTWGAMRRNAHDLVSLSMSRRESGLGQTSTQAVTQRELDSVEVFDFFNYPRQA